MTWLLVILVVILVGAAFVVLADRAAPMARAYDDRRDVLVPADRDLSGPDLERLRFTTAFRGYRADEVDALLARLVAEMNAREAADGPGTADAR